jgi:broad specificity phosphatase PhoE
MTEFTHQVMPKILLWRHGQTNWNIENRFQGSTDIALNEVGRYQAAHAAKILAGMAPTKIVSSPLIRAMKTAEVLADLTGLELQIDSELRETHGGNWEGRTGPENRAADNDRFLRWIAGSDDPAGETGERRSEVGERAHQAILRSAVGVSDLMIVVTHGGTARCVIGKMLELPVHQWGVLGGLSNASWSILDPDRDGKWSLTEHNAGSIPERLFGNESTE